MKPVLYNIAYSSKTLRKTHNSYIFERKGEREKYEKYLYKNIS